MPRLVPIERDFTRVAEKMAAVGPLIDTLGTAVKGAHWVPSGAVDYLRRANGVVRGGAGDGRPSLERDVHLAEAILALSGTTNGRVAVQAWRSLEERVGVSLADLAQERSAEHITFEDIGVQPRSVITSPEWSGSETGGRRYAPFTVNVERKKPWHTLTGRMHFFLDHDWMHGYGEALPVYRPPLNYVRHFGEQGLAEDGIPENEDQEQWHGGWALDRKGRLQLKAGSRLKRLLSIFWNPDLPTIDDYGDPWTYDYQTVINAPLGTPNPSAHSISSLTGRDMSPRWGSNWDDGSASRTDTADDRQPAMAEPLPL